MLSVAATRYAKALADVVATTDAALSPAESMRLLGTVETAGRRT